MERSPAEREQWNSETEHQELHGLSPDPVAEYGYGSARREAERVFQRALDRAAWRARVTFLRRRLRIACCGMIGHDYSLVPGPGTAALWCSRCGGHSCWYVVPPADTVLGADGGPLVIYGPITLR